jgi:hypothetical protein
MFGRASSLLLLALALWVLCRILRVLLSAWRDLTCALVCMLALIGAALALFGLWALHP